MGELLTKQQLSEMLKISVKTVDLWIAKGYGPNPLKIGRMVRFREADIIKFIDESMKEKKNEKDNY